MEKDHCCQTWATSSTWSSLGEGGERAVGALGRVLWVLLTGTSWHQTPPGILRCCHTLCLFNSPPSDYWALLRSHPSHLHCTTSCAIAISSLLCCAHRSPLCVLVFASFLEEVLFFLHRNSSSWFPATSASVLLQHTAIITGTENIVLGEWKRGWEKCSIVLNLK